MSTSSLATVETRLAHVAQRQDGSGAGGGYLRAGSSATPGSLRLARLPASPHVSASTDSSPLTSLLDAPDAATREAAWDALVTAHTRLLLHVARLVMPDRDGAMDAYVYVLEQLRHDDFRALRGYAADGRSRFSTWLAVVARRSCIDFYRHRYGRPRAPANDLRSTVERAARRRLADLVGGGSELPEVADAGMDDPDARLRATELRDVLDEAVAALASEDRLLLKLRFEDDLTAQSIATTLGMPSQFHVYRRLRTICATLRLRLTRRGVESPVP